MAPTHKVVEPTHRVVKKELWQKCLKSEDKLATCEDKLATCEKDLSLCSDANNYGTQMSQPIYASELQRLKNQLNASRANASVMNQYRALMNAHLADLQHSNDQLVAKNKQLDVENKELNRRLNVLTQGPNNRQDPMFIRPKDKSRPPVNNESILVSRLRPRQTRAARH